MSSLQRGQINKLLSAMTIMLSAKHVEVDNEISNEIPTTTVALIKGRNVSVANLEK